jgi:hypothetical protein
MDDSQPQQKEVASSKRAKQKSYKTPAAQDASKAVALKNNRNRTKAAEEPT